MAAREMRLLAYFVEIVRAGSMRAAAERLAVTPPVVSTALGELEQLAGATLLARSTRSMELTELGRELFELASEMVAASEHALWRVQHRSGTPAGEFTLALPSALAAGWLPHLIREFGETHAEISPRVRVESVRGDEAAEACEVTIEAGYGDVPEEGADICANLALDLVCAPAFAVQADQPLAARLAATGYIESGLQSGGVALRAFERTSGTLELVAKRNRIHAPDPQVAKELACAGLGAALVTADAVERSIEEGRLKRVSARHSFGYLSVRLRMRDRMPSPQALAFREYVLAPQGLPERQAVEPERRPPAAVPGKAEAAAPHTDERRGDMPDWML